jgi:hypothetical protein
MEFAAGGRLGNAHGQDWIMKADLLTGGRRSRPLLLLERTMYRDGRTPFISVFTIQVAGELEEDRLRQALARVQARHPLLRCVVEDAIGGPRFVQLDRPAPIPLRILERHGEDDWQTVALREWVTPFDGRSEPLARLVWLRGVDVHELMLAAHHCICDGYSGINFFRECLSTYDMPERDTDGYDALGAIEDIVPREVLESRRFQRRVRWKAGFLRLTFFLKQRIDRKRPGPPVPAEQMYFHRWNIGESATIALTERCRSEDVTVLSAVSLAFMQAFRDVRGVRGLARTRTMVNARRFLPEMRADAMFGLAPGVALRTKGLPPPPDMCSDGFWARARAIRKDMTRRIERLGTGLYENLVAFERLHDKYAGLLAFFEGTPKVRNVTLSNLGRIALSRHYGGLRLERVYSPLVMVSPTPANTIVVSTFAGQMEFAMISDERSLPRVQAIEIRQRAMEILRTCAALPAHHESPVGNEHSEMRRRRDEKFRCDFCALPTGRRLRGQPRRSPQGLCERGCSRQLTRGGPAPARVSARAGHSGGL